MKKELQKLKKDFEEALHDVSDMLGLEKLEQQFFGRKTGKLSNIMKSLKNFTDGTRKEFGMLANDVKKELLSLIEQKKYSINSESLSKLGKLESIDVTQPRLTKKNSGSLHPITLGLRDLEKVVEHMGFLVEDGPELESDYYNFQAINIPEHHPARDGHDTFYIKDNPHLVMRTQTSNMQVRHMKTYSEGGSKSIRVAYPGRVFRNEAIDATHEHTFYQFEALVTGKDINIGHLVGIIKELLRGLFNRPVEVRLRPSYFPFVEPGFELDMKVNLGKGEKWVEMLGCGLIHPEVMKAGGYDSKEWQGLAFAFGVDRLVIAKHGIEDIRHFHSGDLRFLQQF